MQVKGVVVVPSGETEHAHRGTSSRHATQRVANRPIIDHVVDAFKSVGIDQLVVVSSAADLATLSFCLAPRETDVSIEYAQAPHGFTFGDALSVAAPLLGSTACVVHVGSGLLGDPLLPLIRRLRADSPDLLVTVHHSSGPVSPLSTATHRLLRVAELHPERSRLGLAGISLFGPGALGRVSSLTWGAGNEIDLTAAADCIAAQGGSFEVLPAEGWRNYSGDPLDLLELNRIALDRLEIDPHLPDNGGNRIEGRVLIHPEASVRESVIVGPAVIGARAVICDAYIGPYTSIGAEVRIEGAEIERSIIGTGASITHVGGRMVASVVGRDARIFRDFSLPRALRLRVGDRTEVALC